MCLIMNYHAAEFMWCCLRRLHMLSVWWGSFWCTFGMHQSHLASSTFSSLVGP